MRICEQLDDELLFIATDIPKKLGYINPLAAISRHVHVKAGEGDSTTSGQISGHLRLREIPGYLYPQTIIINETGMWSLVLSSRLR